MIDFDKLLECDGGDVIKISDGRGGVLVTTGKGLLAVEYTVYFDGNPINPRFTQAFKVRNKKTNRDRAIGILCSGILTYEECIDALIEAGLLVEDE